MADQGRVILFLVISVIALWGIVISLAAVHIVEFLKKRVRIKAVVLDSQGRVETVCQYCSRKYYFTKEELESLAEQAAGSLKKEK